MGLGLVLSVRMRTAYANASQRILDPAVGAQLLLTCPAGGIGASSSMARPTMTEFFAFRAL